MHISYVSRCFAQLLESSGDSLNKSSTDSAEDEQARQKKPPMNPVHRRLCCRWNARDITAWPEE
jgi:hypothetical protein